MPETTAMSKKGAKYKVQLLKKEPGEPWLELLASPLCLPAYGDLEDPKMLEEIIGKNAESVEEVGVFPLGTRCVYAFRYTTGDLRRIEFGRQNPMKRVMIYEKRPCVLYRLFIRLKK